MTGSASLILVRHGESQWNREQRFTGWADVDLTDEGIAQMRGAATALHNADLGFDVSYSSVLRRCIRSQWVLLDTMNCMWVPQVLDWRLNERHYGALTGCMKSDAVRVYGEAVVHCWRRSFDAEPPPIDAAAAAHVAIDRRYATVAVSEIPVSESLCQTVGRVRSVWQQSIAPALHAGRRVAVVGHGNGLRALTKIIEGVPDDDIAHVEVGNGVPIIYELDGALKPLRKRVLPMPLGRPSEIL